MKVTIIYTAFVSLCISIVVIPVSTYAETARVITKENAIREYCRFFSPVKAKVGYNDLLTVNSKDGDWFRVRFRDITGCIHKSAIEEKAFNVSGVLGSDKQSASEAEVALAGKGFNPQVEDSYKNKHPEMNFHAVDSVESYKIPETKVAEFIKNGGLRNPE